jgi:hypothetical protein
MLEIMYVRCTHCGYDNSPEYRFCGMCGASLAHPPVVETPAVKETPRSENGGNGQRENVHGPSFLGLAEDPKVEFHYLYEDEQPRSHVGLVVFLLITLGAAGYLGWQWRHNGFPFNRLTASTNSGGQASASPSEVAPASSPDQQTHIDKPMTGVGDVLPTQPDQNAQPQVPAKPAEGSTPGQNGSAPQNPAQASNTAEKENAPPAEKKPDTTEEANATPPASPVEKSSAEPTRTRTAKPAPSPKPAPAQPGQAAASPDADLELSGERYLYGNGVPQNCARAESSLRTAALHGNSKAQTVLGTMYATGHCVGRDLPTAYRWFARALHQEPQNTRISADLQVLWRQMTPQEKQLATTSGQ